MEKLVSGLGLRFRLVFITLSTIVPVAVVSQLSVPAWVFTTVCIVAGMALIAGQFIATAGWYRQRADLYGNLQAAGRVDGRVSDAELMRSAMAAMHAMDDDTRASQERIATQVYEAAHDVTNSVALTTQGVSHLKTETENLTHAMEEMLKTAQSVSANAHDASLAANDAEANARDGVEILTQTNTAITTLASQVEDSATVIKELARDSDNIGAILDVIKGVAEQTNLLALNAAIEAARAGEQGRGFAVVADEVRSLASRTHQSTQEIEHMIQRLQQAAQSAVNSMDGGHEIAQQAVEQVGKANCALKAISSAVERIKVMNTQIASASEEQSAVTAEVKGNVETINDVNDLTLETLDGLNSIGEKLNRIAAEAQAH